MEKPKRLPLARIFVAAMDAVAYLSFGLMALLLVAAFRSSSSPEDNPLPAAVAGTSLGAAAILSLIRRINRHQNPRQQKLPPDAP